VARCTEVGPGKPGSVLTVEFTLFGQSYLALNGGPEYKFNPAVSVTVYCKTQKELDSYWEKLTRGGKEVQCGWLVDKFGLSWQVVPEFLPELAAGKDRKKADRVIRAFCEMKKFDIAALKRAAKGENN
jgi:predicted 3-demethylubiquinone-9 3-methyltransferase (glyoxalase superfamily)